MKKVLVLVAAMTLVAANAMAFSSVELSAHNLNNAAGITNPSTEICVFCHTPHGADVSNPNAPLWNRTNGSVTAYYNSATLDQAISAPSVVSASIAASDATLCLSCHNGQAVVAGLNNEPNAGAVTWAGAFTWTSAEANITQNLSDDHPIGMVYNSVYDNDTAGFFGATATGMTFYDGGKMWCSSCHDVHDDTNYPFLVASNAGSDLCLSCHNK